MGTNPEGFVEGAAAIVLYFPPEQESSFLLMNFYTVVSITGLHHSGVRKKNIYYAFFETSTYKCSSEALGMYIYHHDSTVYGFDVKAHCHVGTRYQQRKCCMRQFSFDFFKAPSPNFMASSLRGKRFGVKPVLVLLCHWEWERFAKHAI